MSFSFPFVREAVSQLFSKPSTERFPFVPKEAPERYRGRIIFHADRCINCGMCIRVCSPGAITKTVEKTEEGDKVTMSFDLTSCTFCETCADFCSKDSIEMSRDYAMVAQDSSELIVTGTFIKKPPVKKAVPPKPAPAEEAPAAPEASAAPEAPAPEDSAAPAPAPEEPAGAGPEAPKEA